MGQRRWINFLFHVFCFLATVSALSFLVVLLYHLIYRGMGVIHGGFFTEFPSRFPEKAGIRSALQGTLWVVGLTLFFSVPLGVSAALYLQEYMAASRWKTFLQISIGNLAGMPSIVYGLISLMVFVRSLKLGGSILSGALTLTLLILPVIILSSQQAFAAVPQTLRDGAYGLGVRRYHVILFQVLPAALPGVMTGILLALSRALGESAPLIIIGALGYVAFDPASIHDEFTVLPVQIYNWASRPQQEFHDLAAGAIVVLMGLLLLMNSLIFLIRHRFQKKF